MIFEQFLNRGLFGSNSYIVAENGEGVIIDAGVNADEVFRVVKKNGINVRYVVLTHSHVDHIIYVDKLCRLTGAKVLIHKNDYEAFRDPKLNLAAFFGFKFSFNGDCETVEDGKTVRLNGLDFDILHTPGHTPGGICIRFGDIIFTGDTLFKRSIGRTDFSGGSSKTLLDSVNKLMSLPESLVVYPGHGANTTIGYEKRHNPYIEP